MTNTYDTDGRVAEQKNANGATTCVYYGIGPTYVSTNCTGPSTTPSTDQTIVVDPLGNATTYTRDASFRTVSVKDAQSGVTKYAFVSGTNNISCITDPDGNDHRTALSYDSNGNLTQVIDADNVDPANTSACVLKSGGVSWNYTYTSLNDPFTTVDPRGDVTTYLYDSVGNVTRVLHNKYQITSADSDGDGVSNSLESYLGTDSTAPSGTSLGGACATDSTVNNEGLPDKWPFDFNDDQLDGSQDISAFSPYFNQNVTPASIRFDLNMDGRVSSQDVLKMSPSFNLRCPWPIELTCYVHDGNGLVTSIVESTNLLKPALNTYACQGNTTSLEYSSSGDLLSVTLPSRQSATPESGTSGCSTLGTGNGVDDNGNSQVDEGCPSIVYTYDSIGRKLSVTNASISGTTHLGQKTTFSYDAFNMPLTQTDNLNNTTTRTYDNKGNLKTITDANSPAGVTQYAYDAADRLIQVTDALSGKTTYSYDPNGNLTSTTSAKTNASKPTVNHPESGVSQCGATGTGNGIDDDPVDDGNPTPPAVDDGCPSTVYTYDELNRLKRMTDPLGRITAYAYDAASNLTEKSDPRGINTFYTPDALNRVKLIEYKLGTTLQGSTTIDYDLAGNRADMVDYDVTPSRTQTTVYTYDVMNRLTQTDVSYPAAATVKYAYDAIGNLSQITYPGSRGTVSYTYNADHAMASVQQSWGSVGATTYSYDAADVLKKETLPNGVITDYGYDGANRLTSLANSQPGPTPMSSFVYTLDKVGNRKTMTDAGGTHTYSYDALYRLAGDGTNTYTYDANGNRLTKNSTINYTNDAANQLTAVGSTNYTYDLNGNLYQRGPTGGPYDTFTFDYANRLTQTVIAGVTSASVYNGDGLRVSHTVDVTGSTPVTTSDVWDVNRGVPEVLQETVGSATTSYVYGLGLISLTDGAGNQTYYTSDGLGSTTDLTNSSAAKSDGYSYDAFGAPTHTPGSSTQPFQFTGQLTDADSGLYYLRARYYDPSVGRFLGRDPLAGSESNPGTQNRYAYVENNPTTLRDPSGLIGIPGTGIDISVPDPIGPITDAGGAVLDKAVEAKVFSDNLPFTTLVVAGALADGGDCTFAGDLFIVCSGMNHGFGPRGGFTVGSVFLTGSQDVNSGVLEHEKRHAQQWSIFGLAFAPLYYANEGFAYVFLPGPTACNNLFERDAGLTKGEYKCGKGLLSPKE